MGNRFILGFVLLFFLLPGIVSSSGFENLARKAYDHIDGFLRNQDNIRAAVIKYENYSQLSELGAQQFYQLLISRLEAQKNFQFKDYMVGFSENRGRFNITRMHKLSHMIYLKLIRNRNKLGVGIVIFSLYSDKIVSVKYVEDNFSMPEKEILETKNFGFKSNGFFKVIEIEAHENLLDCRTFRQKGSPLEYYFYYPNKVEIFKMKDSSMKRADVIPIKWSRPYFPVLEFEGKISFITLADTSFMVMGGNFSNTSKIFVRKKGQWQELGKMTFLPLRQVTLNNTRYIMGVRYETGKNIFQNKLIFSPVDSKKLVTGEIFEKKVLRFYDLDFSVSGGNLETLHLIDDEYHYRFFGSNLEEIRVETDKRGASLSILNKKWLAMSDYSRKRDKLHFYKIIDGGLEKIYQNEVDGEITFISEGLWRTRSGFWVSVRKESGSQHEYRLQFWSTQNVSLL